MKNNPIIGHITGKLDHQGEWLALSSLACWSTTPMWLRLIFLFIIFYMFGRRNESDLKTFIDNNSNTDLEQLDETTVELEKEEVAISMTKTYNLGLLVWIISVIASFYYLFSD